MIDDQFGEDQFVVAVQRGDGGTEPYGIHVYVQCSVFI